MIWRIRSKRLPTRSRRTGIEARKCIDMSDMVLEGDLGCVVCLVDLRRRCSKAFLPSAMGNYPFLYVLHPHPNPP
jgi:hypothetical protein